MPAGRPPRYKTPEEMQKDIDLYFYAAYYDADGKEREKPKVLTISGLAINLGFESRQSIVDYNKKDEFSCTIKKARLIIENSLEERLAGNNVAGTIFNLKNNYGWKDNKSLEHSGKDGKPIETKSTLEAGQGVQRVLQSLAEATTGRTDSGDTGSDKE